MILIDLPAELAKLKMFEGRTPMSTQAERKGSSGPLVPYRDATVFASKSAGRGAWERHLDGDELVYVVDGAATLHLFENGASRQIAVEKGHLAVVPAGIWHRFDYPDGITLLTITPGKSDHVRLDVDDPTSVDPERAS
jgi:mannose-6-phosphate isomerase-like protein (cupin superfamily)